MIVSTSVPGASNPLCDFAAGARGDMVSCISAGPFTFGPKNTETTTINIQITVARNASTA